MIATTVFHRHLLVVFAIIAVAACAVGLTYLTRDNTRHEVVEISAPSIQSTSALGHAAWFALVGRLGMNKGTRADDSTKREEADLLLIAQPRTDSATLRYVDQQLRTGATLLVLPKYRGRSDPANPRWVGSWELIAEREIANLLSSLDPDARVVRTKELGAMTHNEVGVLPTSSAPQFIESKKLTPMIAGEHGMLLGHTSRNGALVMVLADPEIVTNRGIFRGDNAVLATRIVEQVLQREGRVLFDEVSHGIHLPTSHPAALLTQFPYFLLIAQVVITALLLTWSRWGASVAADTEHTVRYDVGSLLRAGGRLVASEPRLGALVERYLHHTVLHVARTLGGARRQSQETEVQWLARVAKARSVREPTPDTSDAPAQEQHVLDTARSAYRWREEILRGSVTCR